MTKEKLVLSQLKGHDLAVTDSKVSCDDGFFGRVAGKEWDRTMIYGCAE